MKLRQQTKKQVKPILVPDENDADILGEITLIELTEEELTDVFKGLKPLMEDMEDE